MPINNETVEAIEKFTVNDYLVQLTPFYEYLNIKNELEAEQYKNLIEKHGKKLGISVSQFNSLLSLVISKNRSEGDRIVKFIGILPLFCGDWNVTDLGIYGKNNMGCNIIACSHPILPKERLTNIDTGVEKMVLTFKRGLYTAWKDIVVEKGILASPNSIISLANKGVDVTSVNAKELVKFLAEMDNRNYDIIPWKNSVTRLGYIDGAGFSPYVSELVFDGDENYRNIFQSVREEGDFNKWLDLAREVREKSLTARIILAASFASILIKPCGALPFFVHLWGVESGTGKTVALMLAASVWGNPQPGYYIQTFNSTVVGQEKLAAFLNHLPLCIDELQLANNKNDFDVYKLAEGVGKTRGTKTGGIEKTPTWANTILTTGESPITAQNAGSGALNRVIDIECTAKEKVIENGHETVEILRSNYGFAGKLFAEKIYSEDGKILSAVKERFKETMVLFQQNDTTEKQAMAAALIQTADALATAMFFKDDKYLTVEDLAGFLKSKTEVSAGARGYNYICDFVSENMNNFITFGKDVEHGSIYGKIEGDYVYIINKVFNRICDEGGFSGGALTSYLRSEGLLEIRSGKSTQTCRIGNSSPRCYKIKMETLSEQDIDEEYDF